MDNNPVTGKDRLNGLLNAKKRLVEARGVVQEAKESFEYLIALLEGTDDDEGDDDEDD